MRAAQTVTYQLPSVSLTALGASGQTTVPLSDLPKAWNGRVAHLMKLHFRTTYTPTTTALPDVVGNNNVFKSCDIWDGSFARFVGGFNDLRTFDRMHHGAIAIPDADTDTASGTARYFHRVWHPGPPNFAGAPQDFAIPTGMLSNGEVRITTGALTDLAADCTAYTGTVVVVAELLLADEVRIPPAYQVLSQNVSGSDISIQGRALYEFLALYDSATKGAWSAGDLGAITVEAGQGNIVNATAPEMLSSIFQAAWGRGEVGVFKGQPAAASDDNGKQVNHASPLALVASVNDLQPVLFTGPEHRISKLFLAESSLHLSWASASQSTAVAIFGRILPQPQSVMNANVGKALAKLEGRRPTGGGIKTLSKQPYKGPYGEFMPWTVKV